MSKKILPIICIIVFILSGCKEASSAKRIISASFYPVYITTLNIAKNTDTEITTLAKPSTGCLHDYQLTSGDIRSLDDAEIFIINGAGMEDGFIEQVISSNENLTVVDSSVSTHVLGKEEDCEDDHHHGDHDHTTNSHIWLMPHNVIHQVENITESLCKADKGNESTYRANAKSYIAELEKLDALYEDLSVNNGVKAIILNEGFEYLCEPYGMEVAFSIELDENNTTSAKELASITDNAKNGRYIILAPKGEHSAFALGLSRELGIPVFELDPVTYGELDNYNYYIEAMEYNYSVLKEISEI